MKGARFTVHANSPKIVSLGASSTHGNTALAGPGRGQVDQNWCDQLLLPEARKASNDNQNLKLVNAMRGSRVIAASSGMGCSSDPMALIFFQFLFPP